MQNSVGCNNLELVLIAACLQGQLPFVEKGTRQIREIEMTLNLIMILHKMIPVKQI
jgi:hypothetical protein